MKLLRATWTQTSCRRHPYAWLATEPGDLFDAATTQELSENFPLDSFVRAEASGRGEKDYRNYSRPLLSPNGVQDSDLPSCWRALVEDLMSIEYRNAVARLLGQATAAASVELRLVRHAPTDFLGPHTDRADKLFSHILYFNPAWQNEWGGQFEVLDDTQAVVARVQPRLGSSVLLGRSENSWHQVAKVNDTTASERRSLLVHGIRV